MPPDRRFRFKWAPDYSDDSKPNRLLGTLLLELITRQKEWVHRKVETVSLMDVRTARRHVSVDFQFPLLPASAEYLIPLTLLRKHPLVGFDVRDEGGVALPILTSQQNGTVAWSVLIAAAEAVLNKGASDDLTQVLHDVAFGDEDAALDVVEGFYDENAPWEHGELIDDPGFEFLLWDLAANFILIVPLAHEAGRRRVIKFSYIEQPQRGHALRLTFPETMAWEPHELRIPVPRIGDGKGYHMEFQAPPGIQINEGALQARVGEDLVALYSSERGPGDRCHLYLSGLEDESFGTAIVQVQVPRSGVLRQAFWVSLVTLAIVAAFAWLNRSETLGDRGIAGSLLLAVPGVISLFIARPGEHALASRLLFGVRATLVVLALIPFTGAFALVAVPAREYAPRLLWLILVAATGVCTGFLGLSYWTSRSRASRTKADG